MVLFENLLTNRRFIKSHSKYFRCLHFFNKSSISRKNAYESNVQNIMKVIIAILTFDYFSLVNVLVYSIRDKRFRKHAEDFLCHCF